MDKTKRLCIVIFLQDMVVSELDTVKAATSWQTRAKHTYLPKWASKTTTLDHQTPGLYFKEPKACSTQSMLLLYHSSLHIIIIVTTSSSIWIQSNTLTSKVPIWAKSCQRATIITTISSLWRSLIDLKYWSRKYTSSQSQGWWETIWTWTISIMEIVWVCGTNLYQISRDHLRSNIPHLGSSLI